MFVNLTSALEYRMKAEFQDSGTMSHDLEKEQRYQAGSNIHRRKTSCCAQVQKCEMPVRM